MATTITGPIEGFINLSAIDADWNFTTSFPNQIVRGVVVDWISFIPGGAGDKIAIKHSTDTGAYIFPNAPLPAQGQAETVYYGDRAILPYVDFSDSTLSAGHRLIIKLK